MNPTPAITGLAPGSAVDWSSDGKHVALAGADGNIHVFDGVTLQPEDKEVRAATRERTGSGLVTRQPIDRQRRNGQGHLACRRQPLVRASGEKGRALAPSPGRLTVRQSPPEMPTATFACGMQPPAHPSVIHSSATEAL